MKRSRGEFKSIFLEEFLGNQNEMGENADASAELARLRTELAAKEQELRRAKKSADDWYNQRNTDATEFVAEIDAERAQLARVEGAARLLLAACRPGPVEEFVAAQQEMRQALDGGPCAHVLVTPILGSKAFYAVRCGHRPDQGEEGV